MNDSNLPSTPSANRLAWNKGKLTGPKPPLRPGHVWLIRAKLQLERRTRDLALFNLAIDSKLRGCDLVALCVDERGAQRLRRRPRQRSPAKDGPACPVPRRHSTMYVILRPNCLTGRTSATCRRAGRSNQTAA